jgi:hypothetical protein
MPRQIEPKSGCTRVAFLWAWVFFAYRQPMLGHGRTSFLSHIMLTAPAVVIMRNVLPHTRRCRSAGAVAELRSKIAPARARAWTARAGAIFAYADEGTICRAWIVRFLGISGRAALILDMMRMT